MIAKNSSGEIVNPPVGLVVCGPCACGKSEIASALAQHFQVPYVDADSYHSEANIEKMSNGIPLTDEDRFPWLVTVRQQMIFQKKAISIPTEGSLVSVVAACSALKNIYRNILRGKPEEESKFEVDKSEEQLSVVFVFLNCSEPVLQARINARQGHFMKGNMLSSQLASLEVPHGEVVRGHAVIVNGDNELKDVVEEAVEKLRSLFTSS